MLTRRHLILILLPLAGCASSTPPRTIPPDHPANPNAAEASIQPPSQTLAVAASDHSAPATGESMPGMRHMGHDMGAMKHNTPSSQPATTRAAVPYTCTMHPEVVSDKPGKCPQCGMKLMLKQDAKTSNHGGHE